MDVRPLLLTILMMSAGVVSASLVTFDLGDYSLVLNANLVNDPSLEAEVANSTWPLMVRVYEEPVDWMPAFVVTHNPDENVLSQKFVEIAMSREVLLTAVDLRRPAVMVKLETYGPSLEDGLNLTPDIYVGEYTSVKQVPVGIGRLVETTLWESRLVHPGAIGTRGTVHEGYVVKYAVDNSTTCTVATTLGIAGSMDLEEFERFLGSFEVQPGGGAILSSP